MRTRLGLRVLSCTSVRVRVRVRARVGLRGRGRLRVRGRGSGWLVGDARLEVGGQVEP